MRVINSRYINQIYNNLLAEKNFDDTKVKKLIKNKIFKCLTNGNQKSVTHIHENPQGLYLYLINNTHYLEVGNGWFIDINYEGVRYCVGMHNNEINYRNCTYPTPTYIKTQWR